MTCQGCQIQQWEEMYDGYIEVGSLPLGYRLKMAIVRRMSPAMRRKVKFKSNRLVNRFSKLIGRNQYPAVAITRPASLSLKAGDLVRVKPQEEIEATLHFWKDLRGCTFMDGMAQYCGTVQRILKPVERFMDERDYRMKQCKGVVLLEGAMCQGTLELGRCDRSCYFFWREEWLDKLEAEPA